MKRFSFVLFIHLNSYKSGSKVVLLSVYEWYKYCTKNTSGRDDAITTMLLYLIQKQTNKKRLHHILKVHPVSSLAPLISGLHKFGRKQRFLCFLTIHRGMYGSILDLIQNRSRACFCLAVVLMHLVNLLGGLYWWIISILDTWLCLTRSTIDCSTIICGLKVDVRWGWPVRFDLSARVCAKFGQENGAGELRRDPYYTTKASWRNSQTLQGRLIVSINISSNSSAKT